MATKSNAEKKGEDFVLEVPRFVTMPMVPRLIERAQPIFSRPEPFRRFTIDASELALISPVGLSALASIALFAARRGRFERGFVISPDRKHVKTYLSRMNFNRLLRMREPAPDRPQRSPRRARFRELVEVVTEDDCIEVPEQICAVLKRKAEISDVVVSNLMYCLSELLDNVRQHAESPTNGLACAQAYGGAVELAIADCGIGIRGSLAKNPAYAGQLETDADAVQLALQKGVTSTPGRNTGEGLFFVAELLAKTGKMRLQSGTALVNVNRGKMKTGGAAGWPGTLVGLRFESKKGVPIREIFDRHTPELTLFPLEELGWPVRHQREQQ